MKLWKKELQKCILALIMLMTFAIISSPIAPEYEIMRIQRYYLDVYIKSTTHWHDKYIDTEIRRLADSLAYDMKYKKNEQIKYYGD